MSLRLPVAALTAAALLTTLSACGGGDKEEASTTTTAETKTDTNTESTTETTEAAGGETVTMKDFKFAPASLTVKPGTTIKIVNSDDAPHNLVEKDAGIDSGNVAAKGSGSVKAPDKAGTYKYVCTYHPGMEATLVVS